MRAISFRESGGVKIQRTALRMGGSKKRICTV